MTMGLQQVAQEQLRQRQAEARQKAAANREKWISDMETKYSGFAGCPVVFKERRSVLSRKNGPRDVFGSRGPLYVPTTVEVDVFVIDGDTEVAVTRDNGSSSTSLYLIRTCNQCKQQYLWWSTLSLWRAEETPEKSKQRLIDEIVRIMSNTPLCQECENHNAAQTCSACGRGW